MTPMPTEIIYFALNRWDSMIQREQHLMLGLSRTYRVLFIDPPLSCLTLLFGKIRGEKWTFRGHLHRVNDQLVVYTPPAFPPFNQYLGWVHCLHTTLFVFLVKKILGRLNFRNYIIGIGRPFLGGIARKFNPRLSYYDCSDNYSESPRLRGDKKMLRAHEERILKSVDLVFCSGQGLQEAKGRLNKNCFLIPNGVDLSSFEQKLSDMESPEDIRGIKKPIVGYIGLIDERLDFGHLKRLAQARPDWSIVLIGPLMSKHSAAFFREHSNIYSLGEKDYKELYRYLKMFDVCLIPFKINAFTQKIYPTKLHQYFAAGKPVVSSPLPDLEKFAPWVEFYSDAKEMEIKIERSLREDSEKKALERMRVASENTWDRRVESMIEIFRGHL